MYSDEDGVATKQSQSVYDVRMRILLTVTSALSWLGFVCAIRDGEYLRDNLHFTWPPKQADVLVWSKFLWPILSFYSLRLHWSDKPVSTYLAGLRGSLLSILIVLAKLLHDDSDDGRPYVGVSRASLQLYVALLLAAVQLLFPRRPDLFTPQGRPVDPERSASAFRRYSMQWCTSALALAANSVSLDQLPALDYLTRSKNQPLLVLPSADITLWYRMIAGRYLGFAKQGVLMFARAMLIVCPPYCVGRLLKSLEENPGQTHGAWMWLIGIGVTSVCKTTLNYHLIWVQWSEMGIPVRAQLIMAIFQKALRVKDSKDQTSRSPDSKAGSDKPEAVSLIASDTLWFSQFTAVGYLIPSSFVRLAFTTLFLLNLLGWQSALVSVAVTILCVPVYHLLIRTQRAARKDLTAARSRKSKVVTEALHSLRQIKFSALEAQWEAHIEAFRAEEIKLLRWILIVNNMKSVCDVVAPSLVSVASICMYAFLRGTITPSVIFPLIEVLPQLQETLGVVPLVFQDYFASRLYASRMESFMRRAEQTRVLGPSPSGRVSFRNVSIAWPSDKVGGEPSQEKELSSSRRFSLHSINLEFPVGELSVVSGKTGSGKSLLLAAIIGEVELLGGHIDAPSAAENYPVAFVSQTPWLQNTTIKENILFGSAFDKERYDKVIAACALQPDLNVLAKGDETQIGLRGVKLSGGQRARLAFGRALYSNAQLLVLDDIFSALDSHVSKEIFKALTGELGSGRTRILVTHQVALCLPKAAYVAHVSNNTIRYAGETESIGKEIEIIEAEVELVPERPEDEDSKVEADASAKTPSMKVAPKKAKQLSARTDWNVYKGYFAAAGGLKFTVLYLLGLVSIQVLAAVTKWLTGRVNSSRPRQMDEDPGKTLPFTGNEPSGMRQYIYLYLWSTLLATILQFLFNLHTASGSLRASRFLFREMAFRIIRMPLLWIDTTPFGVMLKVFNMDARFVDDSTLSTVTDFANCLIKLATIIGVGLYTSKYTSLLTLALLIWCAQVSRIYIKARSTIRKAEVEPTANVLEHFTSTSAGVSTIRAFGASDWAVDQMHQHVDTLSLARRHFWMFNRWLGLQISLIGILFCTGTGVILMSTKSFIDTSLLGFSLTFSMGFSTAIFNAVSSFGTLETYMGAAGTLIQHTELETEDQGGIEVPEDWPSKGEVEITGLQIAYSADLPLVLKGVSFTVGSGQRVGVVGRTGAGKSSLTLALLRLLEPRAGSIHIDGIDISTVKLKSLRSRIAFLPQDPVLFSGTVRSNLDYFNQVPEEKLKDAIRHVKLLAEDGDEKRGLFTLDSPISSGGENMSQGQRQLLCLARLLLKDPKIIILDEATSAVDNKTDLLIQETIRTKFSGTLIVVAHRLRTIAQFDRILVMSDGKVAEFGTPADLLGDQGLFFDLVQASQDREFLMTKILG